MEERIRVENLTKKFGDVTVLDGITLSLKKGKIYGFIGRNGSGKTVLFKHIIGYLKPTGGRVVVDGKEIGKDQDFADHVGMIIENPGFLGRYTGYQNLKYLADIRHIIGKEQIRESMRKAGLEDVRNILLDMKNAGKTILISSHHKEDIDLLCDCVYEMERGRCKEYR